MIHVEMTLRMVQLHEIKPYENNVKFHPVRQLESLVQSILQFGFLQPLVLDKDNVIIAGHARYEAAATIGIFNVPCIYAENLTEQQIKAYRILDNKIAELGTVDPALLKIELAKIPDFDLKPFNLTIPYVKVDIDPIKEAATKEKLIQCPHCAQTFPAKGNEVDNG